MRGVGEDGTSCVASSFDRVVYAADGDGRRCPNPSRSGRTNVSPFAQRPTCSLLLTKEPRGLSRSFSMCPRLLSHLRPRAAITHSTWLVEDIFVEKTRPVRTQVVVTVWRIARNRGVSICIGGRGCHVSIRRPASVVFRLDAAKGIARARNQWEKE